MGETTVLHTPPIDRQAAIEDSYELSPMQLGMLYHTIESPQPGMYCIVVCYRVKGRLDAQALFDAWRTVVARHPALRTSFHWQDRKAPVQVVHEHVMLPAVEHDWRELGAVDQHERLAALLESENRRGFELTTPPLMRLTLVRCADEIHELIVAHHHLLLDGSCKPLLFGEVFAAYEAICHQKSVDLGRAEPYRRYIEWLRDQNLGEAERFWREELGGFKEPTPLWSASRVDTPPSRDYAEHQLLLDEQKTDELKKFARANRLTLNTIACGAWALLLGHANKRDDVVFGATVNARPPTLDGVEAMLGLFINTLPVRLPISTAIPLVEWLRKAQLRQSSAREYDFAPLSLIQRWSDAPRGLPLFESIVVFENNPGYGADSERHGSVEITDIRALIRNSLPLTLRCVPGRTLSMQLLYDTRRFSPDTINHIAVQLVQLLNEMTSSGSASVARLMQSLDEVERHRTAQEANAFQKAIRDKLSQRTREKRRSETSES